MAGRLQVEIERMEAHDLTFPAYWLTLQNARCVGGRALNVRHPASFEDLVALHEATGEIIARESDNVKVVADEPGSSKVLPLSED
jgi:hypothetical protein